MCCIQGCDSWLVRMRDDNQLPTMKLLFWSVTPEALWAASSNVTVGVCPSSDSQQERYRRAGLGSVLRLLRHLQLRLGWPTRCIVEESPSCFFTSPTGFVSLKSICHLADGKSGYRHRIVSSASPGDRVGRRLRVSGGTEMDRGEYKHWSQLDSWSSLHVAVMVWHTCTTCTCSEFFPSFFFLLRHLLKGEKTVKTGPTQILTQNVRVQLQSSSDGAQLYKVV